MKRILLVGGGTWHDFAGNGERYRDAFAPLATTEVTEEAGRLSHGGLAGVAAVAIDACLSPFDDGLEDKARGALPEHAQRAVERFVRGGGACLVLHAALVSWPGWRGLGEIAGARWIWGVSGHDPMETFTVRMRRAHPLWAGRDDFSVTDEKYHQLRMLRPVDVLLEADWRGEPQPLGWTTRYGRGRVYANVLGHTPDALGVPAVVEVLRRGAAWALDGTR